MEIEQLELVEFLKTCQPLSGLSQSQLNGIVQVLEITYFAKGTMILAPSDNNMWLYLIRMGAVERTDSEGNVIARFIHKDFFGHKSIERGGKVKNKVIAFEDSLLYMIPQEYYDELKKSNRSFRRYFHHEKNRRLRHASQHILKQNNNTLIQSRVKDIIHQNFLSVTEGRSIAHVAQDMSQFNTTAAVIHNQGRITGIVTDRVFCTNVVANGCDLNSPVSSIMTDQLITISADNTALEAMLLMTKHNIKHLPVVEGGELLGVLTATDIIQHQSLNPIYAVKQVHKATSIEQLQIISRQVPEVFCALFEAGIKPHDIAYAISSIGRAIFRKLNEMAVNQFGEPPIKYAFLIAGSMARNDQTAHSDQDNALLLSDDYDAKQHKDYFIRLAQFVCDGLNHCGYIYCPGDVMAVNEKWRQPFQVWLNYFRKWIQTPQTKALMYCSIFFDMRCVYGDQSLINDLHNEVFEMIARHKIFLSHLTANAVKTTPPLGLFRRFVLEKHGSENKALNMKKRGIMPCTDIARIFALDAGVDAINTRERFRMSYKKGVITNEAYRDLTEAYDYLCAVRIKYQAIKISNKIKPDNFIEPTQLSSLERRHLKDAFELISTYQKVLSHQYTQGMM